MNEVKREGNLFYEDLRIPCYYTDSSKYLKPASFMDMAQEIAIWAAQDLGFGYDDLQLSHTAWVLSRMHFHYIDPPRWRDHVRLNTWHKGSDGLFFLRDFRLDDASGNTIVTGTSSWLVMDVESRRLVRDPEIVAKFYYGTAGAGHAIEEPAPKVSMPRGVEPELIASHTVAYSDVDFLGHSNNARYMVWSMDCIPYAETSGRRVRDVYINFSKETVAGETVDLFRRCSRGDDGTVSYIIEGKVDGKTVFTARIDY